ncbi:hypothetical protein KFE25_010860 [Diacronema lutheri]|uniref:DUF1499 domain-containing protein n=1 Tax=Diacronema lutheri TaxID=2081491 RepID=A0A8J6C8P4_DIALT|nr:hypothetical protein KFE25_010860 [Diacronema lutheri]
MTLVAIVAFAATSALSRRSTAIRGIRTVSALQLASFACLSAYSNLGAWPAPSEAHLAARELAPLDGRPCCIRSGPSHAPIPFPRGARGVDTARALVRDAILGGRLRAPHNSARLLRERVLDERYAHAHYAFRIGLFRFVDDVELLFDGSKRVIHFRSALRVGQGDMGANADRIAALRAALAAA